MMETHGAGNLQEKSACISAVGAVPGILKHSQPVPTIAETESQWCKSPSSDRFLKLPF